MVLVGGTFPRNMLNLSCFHIKTSFLFIRVVSDENRYATLDLVALNVHLDYYKTELF